MISACLDSLRQRRDLDAAQSAAAFDALLGGALEPAQIGALLMGLAQKGETASEVVAAARAMRARMRTANAPDGAIDVCGTGGDGAQTLNISTAVSIVVAACGVPVAKHGNRAASSQSGATDVLSALGLPVDADVQRMEKALAQIGIGYFAAPLYHPALVPLVPLRKSLGMRTIFNLLGPLCNPAQVKRQLVGVASPALVPLFCEALAALGSDAAMIVHGDGGLDELSPSGINMLHHLHDGTVAEYALSAKDFGLEAAPLDTLRGGAPADNAKALLALLDGVQSGYRIAVLMNAGAALRLAGTAQDWEEGATLAARAIDGGDARAVLTRWKESLT